MCRVHSVSAAPDIEARPGGGHLQPGLLPLGSLTLRYGMFSPTLSLFLCSYSLFLCLSLFLFLQPGIPRPPLGIYSVSVSVSVLLPLSLFPFTYGLSLSPCLSLSMYIKYVSPSLSLSIDCPLSFDFPVCHSVFVTVTVSFSLYLHIFFRFIQRVWGSRGSSPPWRRSCPSSARGENCNTIHCTLGAYFRW